MSFYRGDYDENGEYESAIEKTERSTREWEAREATDMAKLSERQAYYLRKIAEGDRMPWHIDGRIIKGFRRDGLIAETGLGVHIDITPAGRAALAEYDAQGAHRK